MKKMRYCSLILAVSFCFAICQDVAFSQTRDSGSQYEIRGVWVHPGYFGSDPKTAIPRIRSTMDEYGKAGINTLIVLIKSTGGEVYYKSKIAPVNTAYTYDFFGVFLEEARKRNMAVHPWFCVFTESAILGQVREHPEWLIRSRKGEMVAVANAALPAVRQYEISLMTEIVREYPVDWVHLDYIRTPCEPTEVYFSFDPETRALFKAYSGEDPLAIRNTDSGNMFWNEWIAWNAEQVTQCVRELRAALDATGRTVRISAAVFPNPDNARVLIAQDWEAWAREGLVDMLCPMLYTNHRGFFEKYVRRAVEIAKGRCQICAGIGISTSHNQNTPEGMLDQVNMAQALGADGVVFFSSNSLSREFLEKLK